MENLYRSAGVLCIIGYISGLMLNLVNTTQTQKAIRLVTALYIISVTFTGFDYVEPLKFAEIEDVVVKREAADEEIINYAAEYLCNDIENLLYEKNIDYDDVTVHINKQTGKAEISEITIYGAENESKDEILFLLSDTYKQDIIKFEG